MDEIRLTPRQHEVARLIAAGRSNAEIARELGLSPRTVKMHVGSLRERLGVAHRRQVPLAYLRATGKSPFGGEDGRAAA